MTFLPVNPGLGPHPELIIVNETKANAVMAMGNDDGVFLTLPLLSQCSGCILYTSRNTCLTPLLSAEVQLSHEQRVAALVGVIASEIRFPNIDDVWQLLTLSARN